MVEKNFVLLAREQANLSQEAVAKFLGVSRPTYMNLEKNPDLLNLAQLEKLAAIFDINVQEFKLGHVKENCETLPTCQKEIPEEEMRISVPMENVEKFKQVLLYILTKVGARPNIGQTAIYKILYFIDFDFYEIYEKQLMGLRYIKNHYGPTPRIFSKVIAQMEKNKELVIVKNEYFDHQQLKYLPLKEPNLSCLSGLELKHIDQELERLADKNAKELSDLSHDDVPWLAPEEGEELNYEAVFYRTEQTSVRSYEQQD